VRVWILLLILASVCAGQDARDWTDTKGKVITATYVSHDRSFIKLRKGEKEYKVPMARLSRGDRDYLARPVYRAVKLGTKNGWIDAKIKKTKHAEYWRINLSSCKPTLLDENHDPSRPFQYGIDCYNPYFNIGSNGEDYSPIKCLIVWQRPDRTLLLSRERYVMEVEGLNLIAFRIVLEENGKVVLDCHDRRNLVAKFEEQFKEERVVFREKPKKWEGKPTPRDSPTFQIQIDEIQTSARLLFALNSPLKANSSGSITLVVPGGGSGIFNVGTWGRGHEIYEEANKDLVRQDIKFAGNVGWINLSLVNRIGTYEIIFYTLEGDEIEVANCSILTSKLSKAPAPQ
jgi:hypothetical protein